MGEASSSTRAGDRRAAASPAAALTPITTMTRTASDQPLVVPMAIPQPTPAPTTTTWAARTLRAGAAHRRVDERVRTPAASPTPTLVVASERRVRRRSGSSSRASTVDRSARRAPTDAATSTDATSIDGTAATSTTAAITTDHRPDDAGQARVRRSTLPLGFDHPHRHHPPTQHVEDLEAVPGELEPVADFGHRPHALHDEPSQGLVAPMR